MMSNRLHLIRCRPDEANEQLFIKVNKNKHHTLNDILPSLCSVGDELTQMSLTHELTYSL